MAVAVPSILFLAACSPDLRNEIVGDLRHQFGSAISTGKGTAKVDFTVATGETAFLFTGEMAPGFQVHVRTLEDPAKTPLFQSVDWNQSPYSKTNGGFVSRVNSFNWPATPDDPALAAGKWRLELGTVDDAEQYRKQIVDVSILSKVDADLTGGALHVSIVLTGDLESDARLRAALDDAQAIWAELYDQIGIEVDFTTYAWPDGELAPPAFGLEDAYADIAAQTRVRGVNLVVTEEIEGLDLIFGIAGDIPGPLVPTARSAVQVSALLAAGTDGRFSPQETRLLAETMAHETLHFLGVYHPVDSPWDTWDVLDDTPECSSESDCTEELGRNLMFPYPVCTAANCDPQVEITEAQGGVANRHVAVE